MANITKVKNGDVFYDGQVEVKIVSETQYIYGYGTNVKNITKGSLLSSMQSRYWKLVKRGLNKRNGLMKLL